MRRFLVINADDLGLNPEINEGAVEALRKGRISDVSLLVEAPYAAEAVQSLVGAGVTHAGIHLDLDEVLGWSPGGGERYPRDVLMEMLQEDTGLLDACAEAARRQIEVFRATGLEPTHLDTHHHVHGFLPVFRTVLGLAVEYGIRALRFSPEGYRLPTRQDIPLDVSTSQAMKDMLAREGIFACDSMVEGAASFLDDPCKAAGTTELVVHPSRGGDPWRAREYDVLLSDAFCDAIRRHNIHVVSFRDLAGRA